MSGRKFSLIQFNVANSISMSSGVTYISSVTNVQFLDNLGIQFNYSGNPTANFFVQASADYLQDQQGVVINAGNWRAITLNPAPAATGSADTIYCDINQTSTPWIRSLFTCSTGAGACQIWVTAKQV